MQQQDALFGVKGRSTRRAIGLRHAKLHPSIGVRHASLLAEYKPFGAQVDGVFHLARRALVVQQLTLGVALQVNVHFAAGFHRTGLLVVVKIVAVNLIEAIGVSSVNDDVDVLQVGAATLLVLHHLGGMNGKQRASAFALVEREALTGLLHLDAKFRGKVLQQQALLDARVKIKTGHHRDGNNGQPGKPLTQPNDG